MSEVLVTLIRRHMWPEIRKYSVVIDEAERDKPVSQVVDLHSGTRSLA